MKNYYFTAFVAEEIEVRFSAFQTTKPDEVGYV
jgi:hypothetical protein